MENKTKCEACGDEAKTKLRDPHGKFLSGASLCYECRDEIVSGKPSPKSVGWARKGLNG